MILPFSSETTTAAHQLLVFEQQLALWNPRQSITLILTDIAALNTVYTRHQPAAWPIHPHSFRGRVVYERRLFLFIYILYLAVRQETAADGNEKKSFS